MQIKTKIKPLFSVLAFLVLHICVAGQGKGSTETSDNTYGPGGTKIEKTEKDPDYEEKSEKVFDRNKTLRFSSTSDLFLVDSSTELTEYFYDCKGNVQHYYHLRMTKSGKIISSEVKWYENNKLKIGRIQDMSHIEEYRDGKWVKVDDYHKEISFTPDTKTCPFDKNEFFIGGSLILEDSKPSFLTYGAEFDYTRLFNPGFGITIDAGANFGTNSGVKYTKLSFMAGPKYFPFGSANANKSFAFSLHALAGVTNLSSNYGVATLHTTNFSMGIGIGADFVHSQQLGLGAIAEYNPVFASGKTASNFRIGLGLFIR